jgi:glycosyltransferase involved in cell wall biosynthesis
MTPARVLLSYRDHTEPTGGGAVHGYHVVDQLVRLGHPLITAEPRTDARLRRYPRTLAGMRALLRDADAVYMRCDARPWDEALLVLNRATTRRPVVVEVNAIAEEQLSYGRGPGARAKVVVLRAQYRGIVRLADAVVCVSNALADFVRATYPIAPDRVSVVPNGGTPAADPPRDRGDGRFRAVWSGGSRWPWQALDTVVAAAAILRERVPGAEVVLYTDGDPARFAGRPGVVHHAPVPHGELPAALREMDAALCLYRPMPVAPAGFYNSPLKLFDCMAAGLPVVASPLGQIAEVVEDGTSGLLVPDDPAAVADALAALARDPERRRRMGAAARARIAAAYTWDHTGDRIEAVLQGLLR